jgi:putative transcriptional regulator
VKRDTKNCVEKMRLQADLTQVALAEKVGVTRQTIIAIEKGDYTPSVSLALRLAKVFKTPVEDLFTLC